MKKRSGGILVLNQSSEKLSDRTIGDEVIIVRARARAIFDRFFQNGRQSKNFFSKKNFFFLVDPKYICMPKMKFIGQKMKKKSLL